ncbi:hypothetical protein OEZ85_011912 [Tetradesmus obliquus]|uniref:KOW domain-containing protein n=1 Tax=Tetradesmus obliquus TaxID=3088 RepID=A0ABY8TU28_TETOB|nr:hypothetical protein OEZ85_011912 [Tetradesmus obliquus]
MQGQAGPGIDQLVQLLLQDNSFARAVQQQDGHGAASAAVGVVRSHLKAFTSALRPPALPGGYASPAAGGSTAAGGAGGGGGDSGSPTFKRMSSEQLAMRRSSDPGLPTAVRPDIRVKDRVIINTNHKRFEGTLVGKEGTVLSITSNGWVKLQVGNETLDIQMRYLTPMHSRGSRPGGSVRKSDVVKQVRKELTQLEEQVPWKEVQGRWRTLRKTWTRRLRQADSTREVAICISEFHDNLKTDKSSGIFAAGGPWELCLRECLSGMCSHLQLQAVWEEMRGALQGWLAEGALPGGLASLDKASYEQAVATYAVLQEAAAKGAEFLEQVPLDQILTSQKELLALQHIIQREAAAAHSRLQVLASGSAAGTAAAAPAVLLPDVEGGLSEAVLLQLGRLPRIKQQEGSASDVDTDKDAGSEATELGDGSDMDIY